MRASSVAAGEPRRARCADDVAFLSPQAQVSTGTVLVISSMWKAHFHVARTKPTSANFAVTQTREA